MSDINVASFGMPKTIERMIMTIGLITACPKRATPAGFQLFNVNAFMFILIPTEMPADKAAKSWSKEVRGRDVRTSGTTKCRRRRLLPKNSR